MFVLGSKITIGGISFSGVIELEINKSVFNCVETGQIKLPTRVRLRKRFNPNYIEITETHKIFKRGDPVTIDLAYDGRFNNEFRGFVTRVDQATPTIIYLEGYSYQLRNKVMNKHWISAPLKDVLSEIVTGTDIELEIAATLTVKNFTIRNATALEGLSGLIKASHDGITAYFVSPTKLFVGLTYTKYSKSVKYSIGRNVIDASELVIVEKDKTDVHVELVSKDSDGKRTRAKSSGKIGLPKKLTVHSFSGDADLKKIADAIEVKKNAHGVQGSVKTFLEPYVQPGYKVIIRDDFYTRGGSYICDSLRVTYGVSGARRVVGVGLKVD